MWEQGVSESFSSGDELQKCVIYLSQGEPIQLSAMDSEAHIVCPFFG